MSVYLYLTKRQQRAFNVSKIQKSKNRFLNNHIKWIVFTDKNTTQIKIFQERSSLYKNKNRIGTLDKSC